MKFKSWFILSEELYLQNNTATIFHRTKSFDFVQQMMNGGFTAGTGDYHGPGLYTTYTLEGTTNLGYGPYVVKLKVNNLKNYFVLEPDIAKQIHGNNWKLKDQARTLKLKLKLTAKQWEFYQKISENGEFGSATASRALKQDGHKLWENGCKGIIYNGSNDGKCICVYAPYEGLQFLAYAHAPTPTTVDFIERNWVKSSKDVSIRSISDLKFPKGTGIGSASVEKPYELPNPEDEEVLPSDVLSNIVVDFEKNNYSKLKFYIMRNKLSGKDVYNLINHAKYFSEEEKMARILGQNNINKLNGYYISRLIHYAYDDKEKMATILGQNNIDKLDGDNVEYLLEYGRLSEGIILKILGQNNINKLDGDNVYRLIKYTDNRDQMATILGQNNIDKISSGNISFLLSSANDKVQMARILGQENINKLTGDNVYYLLHGASDKDQIARILGQDNIDKLSGNYISDLIHYAPDKEEAARILGQNNIDKLNDDNVHDLVRFTVGNKDIMVDFIVKYKKELSSDNVKCLLDAASNKVKLVTILGSNNINKLTYSDFEEFIDSYEDVNEEIAMKKLLKQYYTGKSRKIISLLKQ